MDLGIRSYTVHGSTARTRIAHAAVCSFGVRHHSLSRAASLATESVAARTGDAVGGLLNATLGNLTEWVIALAALRSGQYMLVKASVAGAIVANTLFVLGISFLLGGLNHHIQGYNRVNARFQRACSSWRP
jgi:Ca2+:H+ antiporter